MSRILTAIILFFLFLPIESYSKNTINGKLSFDLSFRSLYDSNILKYSKRDRDRFLTNTDPKPSPLNTLDDFRTDFKVKATYTLKYFNQLDTRFQLTGNLANHLENTISNLGWISFSLRQELNKNSKVLIYYFHEPRYFIRNYTDVQTDVRAECDFALDQWLVKGYFRPVKLIEIVPSIRYKKYAYNEYFTEYDSDLHEYGIETVFRRGKWRLATGYTLGLNENVGFDDLSQFFPDLTDEDREEGNGDYQQDNYKFRIRYNYHLIGYKSETEVSIDIADRYYSTDRNPSIDPIHHGRNDLLTGFKLAQKMRISRTTSMILGVGYYQRDTEASAQIASDVKDYNRKTIWIEFDYQIR